MSALTRVVAVCWILGLASWAQADDRPNFLWITCEDSSPNLGCYGDRLAHTPAIDGLAAGGVR